MEIQEEGAALCCVESFPGNRAPFFSSSFENPRSCSLGLAFLLLGDVVSCRMGFEGGSEVGGLRASLGMP